MNNDNVPALENEDTDDFQDMFPELTPQQLKVAYWYSLGRDLNYIADKMGLHRNTVNMHLKGTRSRLNCANNADIRVVFLTKNLVTQRQEIRAIKETLQMM